MRLLSKLNIHSRKDFSVFVIQFIKFGVVGFSNTFISLAIYYLFLTINPNLYLVGNTVGFIVGTLNSYFWNNRFVFKNESGQHLKKIAKTFITYGSTFLLGTLLLFLMVNYLNISEAIAPLINLILTIPLNFLINKFWAFK